MLTGTKGSEVSEIIEESKVLKYNRKKKKKVMKFEECQRKPHRGDDR